MKISLDKPSEFRPLELPTQTAKVGAAGGGFEDSVKQAISQATETARQADADAEGLIRGDVEVHEAMVSMQKADLVLRLGTTVRNKLLDAYRQLTQAGA